LSEVVRSWVRLREIEWGCEKLSEVVRNWVRLWEIEWDYEKLMWDCEKLSEIVRNWCEERKKRERKKRERKKRERKKRERKKRQWKQTNKTDEKKIKPWEVFCRLHTLTGNLSLFHWSLGPKPLRVLARPSCGNPCKSNRPGTERHGLTFSKRKTDIGLSAGLFQAKGSGTFDSQTLKRSLKLKKSPVPSTKT